MQARDQIIWPQGLGASPFRPLKAAANQPFGFKYAELALTTLSKIVDRANAQALMYKMLRFQYSVKPGDGLSSLVG
ncbi:MAG: hypothetical protein ACJAVZ_000461 [Afipia broomeae]|jgi:hypothetical protein